MRRCWNWEGTNSRQIKCRRWKLSRETTIARWRTAISATTTTTAGPSTPMETAAAAIRPFITIRRQWWLPRLPPPRRQSTKDPSIIIASSGSTIPTAFCRQRRPAPIPARPVKTLLKETTNRPRRLTPLCSALGLNNRRRLRHHHHQRPPHRPAAVRHKKPTNRPLVTTFFFLLSLSYSFCLNPSNEKHAISVSKQSSITDATIPNWRSVGSTTVISPAAPKSTPRVHIWKLTSGFTQVRLFFFFFFHWISLQYVTRCVCAYIYNLDWSSRMVMGYTRHGRECQWLSIKSWPQKWKYSIHSASSSSSFFLTFFWIFGFLFLFAYTAVHWWTSLDEMQSQTRITT